MVAEDINICNFISSILFATVQLMIEARSDGRVIAMRVSSEERSGTVTWSDIKVEIHLLGSPG
jgi:hypothetical protein